MLGRSIDGRAIAHAIEERLKAEVAAWPRGRRPRLDIINVGEDAASQIYIRRKVEAAERVGIAAQVHHLAATGYAAELERLIGRLNGFTEVSAFILQLPLPGGEDPAAFLEAIDPAKDADCLHPANVGRAMHGGATLLPATPHGVLAILDHEKVALKGAEVTIVNHSSLIGRPLSAMLLQRDATVTVCHKFTKDLGAATRRAEVLVTATGVPGLIRKEHVRPGAVVIDVGIARDAQGKVRGDVAFEEVIQVASAVTPVPGGVGPLTVAMLLSNVVAAHRARKP